jgi:polyhydroxyalkanoate synthesis regulator phasin
MHTERKPLQSDPWQQWQAFAALFAPGAWASQTAQGRPGASSFAPFTQVAERFGAAARAYFDAANASPSAPVDAARIFTDSLRELFADFQPWNSGSGSATGPGGVPPGFTPNSPALGATREHQQRWQRMSDAWLRLDEAQRRLQRMGSDVLRDAAATFASRLGASHPPADSPEALRKLYDTWIDCAEDAYGRAAHSDAFCNALAESVNAGSEWRRELQASIEHSAKFLDFPTRSEINTLTQRVKSLEEEVRALRKERQPKAAASKSRPARRKARP